MGKPVNTAAREKRGARGMGSVYQRSSDGRWQGSLSRTGIDGQRERKVVTGATRDVALNKLAEAKVDWKKSPVRKRDGAQVVGRYMDGWVKRVKPRVAPSTWRQREQHTRLHIKPAIGMKRLDRLTTKHIEDMLDDIVAKGLKPRTAGHVRATLRVALGEAKYEGLITSNPAMTARAPKVRSVEQKYLTPEQARLLISSTTHSERGPLWVLAVNTGARAGELCGLSWGDIDLVGRKMHVRKQWTRGHSGYELRDLKTDKAQRVVPLTPEAVDALTVMRSRDEKAGRAGEHSSVFHDIAGDRLDPTRLAGRLRTALKRAGLPVVKFHDLRHTAATLMIASGADIVAVSRVLGHSNVSTTLNIYGHASDKQRVDAVSRLGRLLAGS